MSIYTPDGQRAAALRRADEEDKAARFDGLKRHADKLEDALTLIRDICGQGREGALERVESIACNALAIDHGPPK